MSNNPHALQPVPDIRAWAAAACAAYRPGEAYAYFEGWEVTGFARVHPEGFEFPPELARSLGLNVAGESTVQVPWRTFWEVRVFSEGSEARALLLNGEWRARTRRADENDKIIPRTFKLWGTRVGREDANGGWKYWTEDRGIGVWVPSERCPSEHKATVLVVDEIVTGVRDSGGVAAITDALFRRIDQI
jgi:CRISPR-associated protein (TIGR03984 family)